VTGRYEEVRRAALLPGQTFRAELCHSGGLDRVPNRPASRALHLHCGSIPAVDVQPSLQRRTNERTRQMDQQDRQLMNTRKSGEAGRQTPSVIAEVAKGTPSVSSGAEESAFNERWRRVLSQPPKKGG
jgi:hypothetical protein